MKKVAVYVNVTWNQYILKPLKEYFSRKYQYDFDFFIANTLIPNFVVDNIAVVNQTRLDMLKDTTIVFLTLTDYNSQKDRFKDNDKYLIIQPRNDYMYQTPLDDAKKLVFDLENQSIKEI